MTRISFTNEDRQEICKLLPGVSFLHEAHFDERKAGEINNWYKVLFYGIPIHRTTDCASADRFMFDLLLRCMRSDPNKISASLVSDGMERKIRALLNNIDGYLDKNDEVLGNPILAAVLRDLRRTLIETT